MRKGTKLGTIKKDEEIESHRKLNIQLGRPRKKQEQGPALRKVKPGGWLVDCI